MVPLRPTYSRDFLLSLRMIPAACTKPDIVLPDSMTVVMNAPTRKTRKRGRRGGVLVRYRRNIKRTPLP